MGSTRTINKVCSLLAFATLLLGCCLGFNPVRGTPAHSLIGLVTTKYGFDIILLFAFAGIALVCYFLSVFFTGTKHADAVGKTFCVIGAVSNTCSAVMLSMLRFLTNHQYALSPVGKITLVIFFAAAVYGILPVVIGRGPKDKEAAAK